MIFECNRNEEDNLSVIDFEEEKEIMISIEEGCDSTCVFLSHKNAQKLSNELNRILMEVERSE